MADLLVADIQRKEALTARRPLKIRSSFHNEIGFKRALVKIKRHYASLACGPFRATRSAFSFCQWAPGKDKFGEVGLTIQRLSWSVSGETEFQTIVGIRRHALARIIQRTPHKTLAALSEALPLAWLQMGNWSGAHEGDKFALPMRGGYLIVGEWLLSQNGHLYPVVSTVLSWSLEPNKMAFSDAYNRLAGSLFDARHSPSFPTLFQEQPSDAQKQTIFYAARIGRQWSACRTPCCVTPSTHRNISKKEAENA